MKTIAALLSAFLLIGLCSRSFTRRTRWLLFSLVAAMVLFVSLT
ncbi:hypothetical protein EI42_00124 [Thermosporothrix hazakensis]|jgi:hypothetical protein|uniref:Uncharacterized protein n=1 Tax=Thermosporothrix hazakensis TaxID=644383 RepID=A0A326UBT3_THEHA|nr:hypothetical protein [Thermosporothrix hazakensis]PZW35957.1 hypothetical protein EI42_00124 [Thermosporothrix hazakensis]